MAATKMLHIRVDEDLSADANAIYRSLGLSMSEAIRLFLHRSVVSQGIPLELKVPNATTLEALAEVRQIRRAKKARFSGPEEIFANLSEGKN
jgi:DNA-damage-inducible protein J